MVNREAVPPEQQIWSPSLDQQNPPDLPNIKEEQEELWTKQEEEQLQLLEEADITKFTLTPLKSEDEEEKPQTLQLHQSQTEELRDAEHLKSDADEEHSGRSEPDRNLNPDNHLETATHDKTPHSSEPETEDGRNACKETGGPKSGLNFLQNSEVLVSEKEFNTVETSTDSSECAGKFDHEGHLQDHSIDQSEGKSSGYCGKKCTLSDSLRGRIKINSEGKHFSCPVCQKSFQMRVDIVRHMTIHTGEKPFNCSVCGHKFARSSDLTLHLRVHTGEKPFSCSVCNKKFARNSSLTLHLRVHTGEKPFQCSICKASFTISSSLYKHTRMHSGEKPFSCSICGKTFGDKWQLKRHAMTHTGEKPFSCSVCGKRFALHRSLRRHSYVHTGEKPFSCSICDKRFARLHTIKKHKCVGDNSRNK